MSHRFLRIILGKQTLSVSNTSTGSICPPRQDHSINYLEYMLVMTMNDFDEDDDDDSNTKENWAGKGGRKKTACQATIMVGHAPREFSEWPLSWRMTKVWWYESDFRKRLACFVLSLSTVNCCRHTCNNNKRRCQRTKRQAAERQTEELSRQFGAQTNVRPPNKLLNGDIHNFQWFY